MNEKDRKNFKSLMERAKVILPSQTKLTVAEETLRIDVFWEALKLDTIEHVSDAFQRAYKELKWFPTPSEIIHFIEEEIEQEYKSKPSIEINYRIEWMEPTEQGRKKAKEFINELYMNWVREDLQKEQLRKEKFEKNRLVLKNQAKQLKVNP